jgi:hypothetical protein
VKPARGRSTAQLPFPRRGWDSPRGHTEGPNREPLHTPKLPPEGADRPLRPQATVEATPRNSPYAGKNAQRATKLRRGRSTAGLPSFSASPQESQRGRPPPTFSTTPPQGDCHRSEPRAHAEQHQRRGVRAITHQSTRPKTAD